MSVKAEFCPNCFGLMGNYDVVCPMCGYDRTKRDNYLALPMNGVLKNRYIAGRVLGSGGFGITYKGFDMDEKRICAIKEYVPLENATRKE